MQSMVRAAARRAGAAAAAARWYEQRRCLSNCGRNQRKMLARPHEQPDNNKFLSFQLSDEERILLHQTSAALGALTAIGLGFLRLRERYNNPKTMEEMIADLRAEVAGAPNQKALAE